MLGGFAVPEALECTSIGSHVGATIVAGVPLKNMVAGVAMGLILEEDGSFVTLTDILGSEDALGDMDFKIAGSEEGVTAFQMDIKASFCASNISTAD